MTLLAILRNYTIFLYYKLRKKNIPDVDHVVRYLRPGDVDSGTVLAAGFAYKKNKETGKPKEKELSVNWLEFFNKNASIEKNVENVRGAFLEKNYTLAKNGKFAVLNVKEIIDEVKDGTSEHTELVSLVVKHTPTNIDLSHSSIFGMPFDSEGELLVSTILANYANNTKLIKARN